MKPFIRKRLPYILIAVQVILIMGLLFYIVPGRYRLYDIVLYDASENVPANPLTGYAPRAELTIVEGSPGAVRRKIEALAQQAEAEGKRVGILTTDEAAPFYRHGIVRSAGTRADEITIARHLFGILRAFDDLDVSVIYSEAFDSDRPGDEELGKAVMNRLIKAAGHRVIQV